jgi:thiamine biosynthesis lipoprotein
VSTVVDPVRFDALGTTAVLLVTDAAARDAARAVLEDEVGRVDRACSRFRPDSDLSRVNASPGEWVAVSTQLLAAVDTALRAARLTGGLVDPTVGSALRVLGYDRDFAAVTPDGPAVTFTVGPVAGWRTVGLDKAGSRLRVPPGVELDLGATAKALCVDQAAVRAAALTGAGVLVSIGGDIAVAGECPEDGWQVRVTDDHAAPPDAPGQTVALRSGGLATSGTSRRRWVRGGTELHHLIDPSTGRPAAGGWRTVTVAAGSCVDANIASTAAMILGEGAVDWLEGAGLPARLVGTDGQVTAIGGWPSGRDRSCWR